MKKCVLFFMAFFTALCVACDSKRVYEANYDFEDKSWNMDTIPLFTFEIKNTAPKNLLIHLRNTIGFPYQNVYITCLLEDSTGHELTSQLINFQLFDEKTGKPFGKGNSIYQHQQPVLEGYTFPYEGKFSVKAIQYMREVNLREMVSVGVRVEEAE